MLIHLGLYTGSFYTVDNLHLLIVVTLLSFGTGHAIFRSKFGFITLAFLSLFIYFIYFQIQGAQWSIIAISSFIAGIVYAYRESSEGMLDDWSYRAREFLASVRSKFSIKMQAKRSQADNKSYESSDSYQQAYKAEQARREQEAKAQRERQKNQSQQQEEPQRREEKPKQERAKQQHQRKQKQKESIEKNKPVTDKRTNLEILGLSSGFTQAELKTAKKRASQKVHRDKWPGRSEQFLQAMDEEQKLINIAYDKLKS